MNKQIINDIIKVSVDESKVYFVIETKDKSYNCYEEIVLSNDVIRFVDDDNNRIVLEYEDITGIKVTEIQNVIQCVIEGEKVKDSVAETVPLSHLLITSTITLYLPARFSYNNNINNTINVTIITYTTHTVSLILSYLSASYVNNSIYFTILTTAIDIITDTYTSSNV